MSFPQIPGGAPFTPEQQAWLNGFMAAAFSPVGGSAASAGTAVATAPAGPEVTILWGSQTGNAETLAKKTAKALKAKGMKPNVVDLGGYEPASLPKEENVLVITSTYGDGEPPDNAAAFVEGIFAESAPKLEGTPFAVFALGDTEYPDFCKCGIDIDVQLEKLGGSRLATRVDADVDFDDPFDEWLASLPAVLQKA